MPSGAAETRHKGICAGLVIIGLTPAGTDNDIFSGLQFRAYHFCVTGILQTFHHPHQFRLAIGQYPHPHSIAVMNNFPCKSGIVAGTAPLSCAIRVRPSHSFVKAIAGSRRNSGRKLFCHRLGALPAIAGQSFGIGRSES